MNATQKREAKSQIATAINAPKGALSRLADQLSEVSTSKAKQLDRLIARLEKLQSDLQ